MELISKPIVSYYKSGNPTLKYDWVEKLTDINIIQTKTITDDFIRVCIKNSDKIFLHIVISGMGKSIFEPNIDSVKTTFLQIAKLITNGFPQNQILVVVSPILSNDNGLKSLELLLRVFTEFKVLRLRFVRFSLLQYKSINDGNKNFEPEHIIGKKIKPDKFVISNENILKRQSTKQVMRYLNKTEYFFKEYYKLLRKYENIISIDKGEEPLIGVRELLPFGFNNSWKNPDGTLDKIIYYDNGNKYKPLVNIISSKNPIRCEKRCLLCYWKQ
jgi:hypothetical protein